MTKEKTVLNGQLVMPDKFCLYSGMRNPSSHEEISWQQYDTYTSKPKAVNAMRSLHNTHGGLWLIVRETPVAGFLPERKASQEI